MFVRLPSAEKALDPTRISKRMMSAFPVGLFQSMTALLEWISVNVGGAIWFAIVVKVAILEKGPCSDAKLIAATLTKYFVFAVRPVCWVF